MKKGLLLVVTSLLYYNSTFALDLSAPMKKKKAKKAFNAGQNTLHAGVGFVPFLLKQESEDALKVYGETEKKKGLVIGARYEIAVTDFLSVGAIVGISNAKLTVVDVTNPDNINGYDMKFTVIGLRAAYHLRLNSKTLGEKLDPYAGGMFGVCLTGAKAFGERNYFDEPESFGLTYAIYAGATFYIIEKVGLFAEIGYKYALVNTGVTFKF